jgi:hypothetical protein
MPGRAVRLALLAVVALAACGNDSNQNPPPACQPTTCAALGAACGVVGDGCGATLECGTCASGQICGGAGAANQCAPAKTACTPATCAALGASCGSVGDGCGGTLDCGTCGAGQACGAGGKANACGTIQAACTPTTCAAQGKNCGTIPDGCGGTLVCGTCGNGQTCGANGATANVCATPPPTCTKTTCDAQARNCGTIPDGCGGSLECGTCATGQTCGGGGQSNVCAVPPLKGGETRWVAVVEGDRDDFVDAVAADDVGNAFVATHVNGPTGAQSVAVRKYDRRGALVWTHAWNAPAFVPQAGLAAVGGGVYVALRSNSGAVDYGNGQATAAPVVVKLKPDGSFDRQLTLPDSFAAPLIASDASGRLAAVYGPYPYRLDVWKADGTQEFSGPDVGMFAPPAFDPDGNVLFLTFQPAPNFRQQIAKVDRTGKVTWTTTPEGFPSRVVASGRGAVLALDFDHLASYDAVSGASKWRVLLPMWGRGLAADGAGGGFVVGNDNAGCNDFAVRRYDAQGKFLWSRMIAAKGSCGGAPQPSGAAVASDGDLVVGGWFSVPADFGKGEVQPKSVDGFLLDLAP